MGNSQACRLADWLYKIGMFGLEENLRGNRAFFFLFRSAEGESTTGN